MALNPVKVPVQFRGLETKLDPKQAVVGDLTLLENVRFDRPPKLQKRFGTERIAKAESGFQIAAYKRELLVGTGSRLMSYTPTGLQDKGVLEALTVYSQPVTRNVYTQQMPDSAVHSGGIAVFAWESIEAGVTVSRYTVFDSVTRQPVISNILIGTSAVKPKTVPFGQEVFIIYYETTTNRLSYVLVHASNPTVVHTPVVLATDPKVASKLFDATSTEDRLYVVYADTSDNVIGLQVDLSLAIYTPTVILATTAVNAVSVFTNEAVVVGSDPPLTRRVWVTYAVTSTGWPWVTRYSQGFVTQDWAVSGSTITGLRNICGISVGADNAVIFCEFPEAGGSPEASRQNIRFEYFNGAGTLVNGGYFAKSVGLASKPFTIRDRVHVLTAHQSNNASNTGLQNTYFLMSFDPAAAYATATSMAGVVVGKAASGIGGGLTKKTGLPEANLHTAGVYGVAALQVDRLFSVNGGTFTQAGVQGAVFDFRGVQESIEMGDTLLLTGGILSMYDGTQVCEQNFHLFPEGATAVTAGGGNSASGVYAFCVVYEWMDNYGLVHQSSPSPVVTLGTLGAPIAVSQKFTYTLPTLRLTSKKTPVSIVVYRTKANESVMYRVNSVATPLLNVITSDTATYEDTLSDAALGGNPQLVFNPLNNLSEVPPLAMDAPLCLLRYRNRVVVIPSEAQGQWMYSKAVIPGVPIEFNPQQFFNPVQGGSTPIVCGVEMDDKLILFASDRIYYTVGDGPAPNGTGNDYGNAFRVPSDVGCSNSNSIALTPQGVIFQSDKGIYLLGRDLSVSYIGSQVEAYNGVKITSATLVPGSRRAVFTLAEGNVALVFDYFVQKWSVWTRYGAATATNWSGGYARLLEDGTVLQETPGAFTDEGSAVNIRLRTSWLSFANLSGLQRVWRFILQGSYMGPHTLMISVAYDNNPSPIQHTQVDASLLTVAPNIYGSTTPYGPPPPPTYGEEENTSPVADTQTADIGNPGGGAYPPYEWQVKLLQQKSTNIQVTITEVQSQGVYTEGLDISSVTFLIGEMPKLHKVPARRSI